MTSSSNSPESKDTTGSTRSVGGQSLQTVAGTRGGAVLSTHFSEETEAVPNAIRVSGHEALWIHNENVTSWIKDGSVRLSPVGDIDRCLNSWWRRVAATLALVPG